MRGDRLVKRVVKGRVLDGRQERFKRNGQRNSLKSLGDRGRHVLHSVSSSSSGLTVHTSPIRDGRTDNQD